MAVVLSNGYNGLMITGLNAPFPGWRPETVRDLRCASNNIDYTALVKTPRNITEFMKRYGLNTNLRRYRIANIFKLYGRGVDRSYRMRGQSKNCFSLLSPTHSSMNLNNNFLTYNLLWIFVDMVIELDKMLALSPNQISRKTLEKFELLNPKHSLEPSNDVLVSAKLISKHHNLVPIISVLQEV